MSANTRHAPHDGQYINVRVHVSQKVAQRPPAEIVRPRLHKHHVSVSESCAVQMTVKRVSHFVGISELDVSQVGYGADVSAEPGSRSAVAQVRYVGKLVAHV